MTKCEYDDYVTCNKCGAPNEFTVIDTIDRTICEVETVCKKCKHKDYWAYGKFDSSQFIESKCKKIIF